MTKCCWILLVFVSLVGLNYESGLAQDENVAEVLDAGEIVLVIPNAKGKRTLVRSTHFRLERLGDGTLRYSASGHTKTDEELQQAGFDLNIVQFSPQGDYTLEALFAAPSHLVRYQGHFQVQDPRTGWQIPATFELHQEQDHWEGRYQRGNPGFYTTNRDLDFPLDGPLWLQTEIAFIKVGFGKRLLTAPKRQTLNFPVVWHWNSDRYQELSTVRLWDLKTFQAQRLGRIQLRNIATGKTQWVQQVAVRWGNEGGGNYEFLDDQGRVLGTNNASEFNPYLITYRRDLLPLGATLDLTLSTPSPLPRIVLLVGVGTFAAALLLVFVMRRRWLLLLRRLVGAAQALETGTEQEVVLPQGGQAAQLGQTLQRFHRRAQRSETLREQLMRDVAHELRTPISVIRADLEALLDHVYQVTPEQLMSIYDKTLLLARLVEDLSQLTQAQAGVLALHKRPLEVEAALSSLVEGFRPAFEAEHITLALDVTPNLPSLQADPQRLQQILLNLLDNARRHTPAGGRVCLGAQLKKDTLVLSVQDSGCGISEADLPYIFERFYRSDEARTRARGGTGLGLAISKALVEAHGGRIWVENAPQGGTRACVAFSLVGAVDGEVVP